LEQRIFITHLAFVSSAAPTLCTFQEESLDAIDKTAAISGCWLRGMQ